VTNCKTVFKDSESHDSFKEDCLVAFNE
jgi:hypothetical protein